MKNVRLKHIIEAQQFSREWLENKLFPMAKEMEEVVKEGGSNNLSGKRMVTFFMKPALAQGPHLR